jgi:hypothetical protein
MRRPLVTSSIALALALAPVALFAQTAPPAQQPPATAQEPAAAQPAAPKLTFASPAGVLLVQIKPDQTGVFEEMAAKLKAGLAKSEDPTLKQQAAGFKIYKAAEPFGTNALYVIHVDPVVANSEYDLFAMLLKTMTPEEQRAPEAAEMWKRYQNAFAAGLSRLSLTPIGGM